MRAYLQMGPLAREKCFVAFRRLGDGIKPPWKEPCGWSSALWGIAGSYSLKEDA